MTTTPLATPRLNSPPAALAVLLEHFHPVAQESVPLATAAGRVLAAGILADRDSPPCDTSAMDGYAVRLSDLTGKPLPVAGQVRIGTSPPPLPPGAALHIVTGAAVPPEADAVIRIEDVDCHENTITLRVPASAICQGLDIRRQGENIRPGMPAMVSGTLLTPAAIGTLAAFGQARPTVYRRVRVGILTTGDEVLDVHARPQPWQIRNTNAATLQALFSVPLWAQVLPLHHAADDADAIQEHLLALLGSCDLVLLTGGVSMGDRDYVPAVAERCGCQAVFHKLPIRPGKPILAAIGPAGQAVFGLPGNPVSVMTTAVRFASPVGRRLAGLRAARPALPVRLANPDTATAKLWWSRAVTLSPEGTASVLDSRGSGDIAATAASDGFVELPPGAVGEGPWPFYPWEA